MSYDPTLPTTVDRIRMIVGDTSNDVTTEMFPDATYISSISMYTNWKRSAADMAEATAVELDRRRTSVSFPGDMSVGWGDTARTLRAMAIRFRREADDEDAADDGGLFGPIITVRSRFLTGSHGEGDLW